MSYSFGHQDTCKASADPHRCPPPPLAACAAHQLLGPPFHPKSLHPPASNQCALPAFQGSRGSISPAQGSATLPKGIATSAQVPETREGKSLTPPLNQFEPQRCQPKLGRLPPRPTPRCCAHVLLAQTQPTSAPRWTLGWYQAGANWWAPWPGRVEQVT